MIKTIKKRAVKIRTPHVCFGCGREFSKGVEMEYSFQEDGGVVFSSYLCGTCQKVVESLASRYGYIEYGHGDLRDDALELEKTCGEKER